MTDLGLADNFLDAAAVSEVAATLARNSTLLSLNLAGLYTASQPLSCVPPPGAATGGHGAPHSAGADAAVGSDGGDHPVFELAAGEDWPSRRWVVCLVCPPWVLC